MKTEMELLILIIADQIKFATTLQLHVITLHSYMCNPEGGAEVI